MRKFSFLIIFLLCSGWGYAATLTSPVIDLGTVTYTSSTPGTCLFSISGGTTWSVASATGECAAATGTSYTAFNATNMQNYGTSKYVHIRLDDQNPTPPADNCGTLTITNLQVKQGYADHFPFSKKGGNPTSIRDYPNGIFFPFVATIEPVANKGRCTITQTYNIFRFAEGSSTEPSSSAYSPFNITFSITLVTPGNSLEHDENATLNFGTFCKASQTQNLTILPNGTVATSSTVCPASADISADSFTFKSSQASSFSVAVPSTPVTLTNPITGTTLQVSNFQPSCTSSCTVLNNTATVTVGGTLTVPGSADIGDYTGSYPISITY